MKRIEFGAKLVLPCFLVLAASSASATAFDRVGSSGTAPSIANPKWERAFEGKGAEGWVSSLLAIGRDDWFVGGGWGVARSTKAGVETEATKGRAVLGLFFQAPDRVFALGQDELILRFDGSKWIEEHVGPKPKRRGRGADLLHSAFYETAARNAPLVAFGPWLVLVRQSDGSWTLPPEAERSKLSLRGDVGPGELALPAKCDRAGWFWLGPNQGWLDCHDRRGFIVDGQTMTAKGKIPKQCGKTVNSLVMADGEIYASCGSATLWKTENEKWQQIATPKSLKEISSISFAAGCLFAASGRTVWRSCGP